MTEIPSTSRDILVLFRSFGVVSLAHSLIFFYLCLAGVRAPATATTSAAAISKIEKKKLTERTIQPIADDPRLACEWAE